MHNYLIYLLPNDIFYAKIYHHNKNNDILTAMTKMYPDLNLAKQFLVETFNKDAENCLVISFF